MPTVPKRAIDPRMVGGEDKLLQGARFERQGCIGRIVLSPPPRSRTSSGEFLPLTQLDALLSRWDLKGVVVHGDGRHFCAGLDGPSLEKLDAASRDGMRRNALAILERLAFAPVPSVAAIRGACLGAGLEIALACHFRIASETALLGLPEPEYRLSPEDTGGGPDPSGVVGRLVGAQEARRLGLVDELVPSGAVVSRAMAFLRALVEPRPPHVIRGIVQSIRNARRLPLRTALVEETRAFLTVAWATVHAGERP